MYDSNMARPAMSAELLDAETEQQLVRAWRDHGDEVALHRLVTAYMRLAVKIANQYRRYGVPVNDLIQEASIGLMKAAQKFDPDREVRFSTYAVWWIKAAIKAAVMRDASLVRVGTTKDQKNLFFNFNKARHQVEREATIRGESLSVDELNRRVAEKLGVPLRVTEKMAAVLQGDILSLNAPQAGEGTREWLEVIEDDGPSPHDLAVRACDRVTIREWLIEALRDLKPRERMIITARKLADEPETLESLGTKLNLSKERVRQLEAQALRKMRRRLEKRHGSAVADLAKVD